VSRSPNAIAGDVPDVRRRASPLLVGSVGLAIGVAIALRLLVPSGMDPTVFLAFGEEAPIQTEYARERVGEVTTRDDLGHDGKFFFIQANDPWFLEPERNAAVLDRPAYRGERMLYPMIAGGFGLFPPGLIVWSMLVTNLLALAIGAALVARLAVLWDASPWLGLAVPLNVGLIFEIGMGGAGVVAYVFCLGALLALVDGRGWLGAFLFAAAALSREVMVAFAVGVVVLGWLQERRIRWRMVITPIAAMALWYAYLRWRLVGFSGTGGGGEIFAPPFMGMLRSFASWIQDPSDLILNVTILFVVGMFTLRAFRSRLPIVWGAIPFVALATVLSRYVWGEPFDLSRALAPVITAVPFLILISRDRMVTGPMELPTKEPA
jgi:hypothetical protein